MKWLWKIIAGRNAEDAKKLDEKEKAEEDRLRRLEIGENNLG